MAKKATKKKATKKKATKKKATKKKAAKKKATKKKAAKKKAAKQATPGKKKAARKVAANKTQPTGVSVAAFLDTVEDAERRKDCKTVARLMRKITGAKPRMWGPSIVGFGELTYTYASGRTGEWFPVGFSPRKRDLTLYIMSGFSSRPALLKKLGKHKTGKACLYVKTLADIDLDVLEQLLRDSVAESLAKQRAC